MTTDARRPSCLIEGTREFKLMQAGELYFEQQNADFRHIRRILRWLLDDTGYYGSTPHDIEQFFRVLHNDAYENQDINNQLECYAAFGDMILSHMTRKAKDRYWKLASSEYLHYRPLQRQMRPLGGWGIRTVQLP